VDFKRENIPKHLRDICPTMFGSICPVDTPDRDNCGVLQNLIPNVSDWMKSTFYDERYAITANINTSINGSIFVNMMIKQDYKWHHHK
jgi:DNA-directed RNA polymerase beta subunit